MNKGVFREFSTRWLGHLFSTLRKRRSIRECVDTLPVLRTQICEAAKDVEGAVGSVCVNFQSIADRSSETVAKAAAMLGNDQADGATVARSVETARATIGRLLQRMERAGQISALAIERMAAIEHSVHGMESLVAEVQRISFVNKLVALNAKIEAVHVGALGAGFEVVAEEISRQAERTTQLAEGIEGHIRETRDCVHSAAGDLREFVAEDLAQSVETRQAAEDAMQVLISVHQSACDSVAMMTSQDSRLRDEISQAVVNLQFQDRFGQRVAHVAEALEKMERMLGEPAHSMAAATADSGNSLLEGMQAAYSMHDERVAHSWSNRAAPSPATDGMEVELF